MLSKMKMRFSVFSAFCLPRAQFSSLLIPTNYFSRLISASQLAALDSYKIILRRSIYKSSWNFYYSRQIFATQSIIYRQTLSRMKFTHSIRARRWMACAQWNWKLKYLWAIWAIGLQELKSFRSRQYRRIGNSIKITLLTDEIPLCAPLRTLNWIQNSEMFTRSWIALD